MNTFEQGMFYTILLMLGIMYYIVPCIWCGIAAHRRGFSGVLWFLFGVAFTPLLGFLAIIAMGYNHEKKGK